MITQSTFMAPVSLFFDESGKIVKVGLTYNSTIESAAVALITDRVKSAKHESIEPDGELLVDAPESWNSPENGGPSGSGSLSGNG